MHEDETHNQKYLVENSVSTSLMGQYSSEYSYRCVKL